MNRLERFEQGQMTASSAEFLAQTYGNGATIDEFAASLPKNARIIDVGAGLSDFGSEVALRRDDIQWTNFDYNYQHGTAQYELWDTAMRSAPPNVDFVKGDVLDMPNLLKKQHDLAYSYNLVTHLTRIKREIGNQALTGMVELLKLTGKLMVGPTNSKMATDERWQATALEADVSADEIAEAQRLLTSSRIANIYYNAAQASGVGIYPATRFSPEAKGRIVLSDDGGQTSHRVFSLHGLALSTQPVAGLFHS